MGVPTMLPTMRYDPDWDVVWVWPDPDTPFLVSRSAIEGLLGRHERLTPNDLLNVCEAHKALFDHIATLKLVRGYVDRKGRAVIMPYDVKQVAGG